MTYHVWYCFVGTSWIPPQRWQASMLFRLTAWQYICWLSCAKRKIYNIHAIGIIITKSTHFDYHLRISEVRCWLKDWYWLHYWPWAIDACRDPWRWKRPWWIGKEGKSCSRKMERKPWHLEFSSDFSSGLCLDREEKWCGGSPGLTTVVSKLRKE